MNSTHLISTLADAAGRITLDRLDALSLPPAPRQLTPSMRTIAVIDCETLGLELSDPVVEVCSRAVVLCTATGQVYEPMRLDTDLIEVAGRQDPGRPVPPHITELTGLNDADLAGQRIPWARLARQFAAVDLIVAHNAAFDCPRIEGALRGHAPAAWRLLTAELRLNKGTVWACTRAQVDWRASGAHRSVSLEPLSWQHGFWYPPHRAAADVYAVVELLRRSGAGVELWRRAHQTTHRVIAHTPYRARHDLKAAGYRWDPDDKRWWTEVEPSQLQDELRFVESRGGRATHHDITPQGRFKGEGGQA